MKRMLLAAGLAAALAGQGWSEATPASAPPAAPADPAVTPAAGPSFEARLAALEQELEDLKTAQAEQTAKGAGGPNTFRVYWDKALKMETADKQFSVRIGGRINYDIGFPTQDAANRKKFGLVPDQSEIRRARIELEGTAYSNYYWKFQVDFGGGAYAFKDVFLGIKDIPVVGSVQVGNQFEPFCLEQWTSDKYDPFIEYSMVGDALTPQRHPGIVVLNNYQGRVAWQLGVFRGDSDSFGTESSDSGYALTARLCGTPLYMDDGKELIHIGAAYSRRDPMGSSVSYSERPEWHGSSKKFVSTGTITGVDGVDLLGLEAAAVFGPFSVQGEWINSNLSRTTAKLDSASFNGWYTEASWFITGEHRTYNGKTGEFTRVSPKHDVGKDGFGAWEAVARFSSLDLNDTGAKIAGGKEDDFTLGLNWYLNSNMRVMFNYIHATTSTPDNGGANIALVRFQADF